MAPDGQLEVGEIAEKLLFRMQEFYFTFFCKNGFTILRSMTRFVRAGLRRHIWLHSKAGSPGMPDCFMLAATGQMSRQTGKMQYWLEIRDYSRLEFKDASHRLRNG